MRGETVWLVQNADYPMDQVTYGVASSVEAGADMLRRIYRDYPVTWGEIEHDSDGAGIGAKFEDRAGLCIGHAETFTFTPYVIDRPDD